MFEGDIAWDDGKFRVDGRGGSTATRTYPVLLSRTPRRGYSGAFCVTYVSYDKNNESGELVAVRRTISRWNAPLLLHRPFLWVTVIHLSFFFF